MSVAPHVIGKGLPTTGLLAQVQAAKCLDHLPLYRQEDVLERAGHALARSTLAQWVSEGGVRPYLLVDALAVELRQQSVLHANEKLVAMLKLGNGKTPTCGATAASSSVCGVIVFEFAHSRGGRHARDFFRMPATPSKPAWQGKLVCDDFAIYKARFELGVTEVGCMAHVRRKFYEL